MSLQQARRDLATALTTLCGPDGWRVTTETDPDLYHQQIVVGHAALVEADTMDTFTAEIPLTAWVSEGDDLDAADLLYDLISGPRSLLIHLARTGPVEDRIRVLRAREVGRRDQGATGWLAVDIDVATMTGDWDAR